MYYNRITGTRPGDLWHKRMVCVCVWNKCTSTYFENVTTCIRRETEKRRYMNPKGKQNRSCFASKM